MIYMDIDLVAEVRQNREELLKLYDGIDGLHRHMEQERPKLEEDGWNFVSLDEVLVKKRGQLVKLPT